MMMVYKIDDDKLGMSCVMWLTIVILENIVMEALIAVSGKK
jgi:hypothetical protein